MKAHVLLCYKNFSNVCHVSHIGLGVTAAYTAKTLNQHGYHAEAMPIYDVKDLTEIIECKRPNTTHVVIMAQFITTNHLATLCRHFPFIKFAVNCHSNVGFLQAEPNAIRLLRETMDLEMGVHNFVAAGNNKRFVQAMERTYGQPLTFLPNLYHLHGREQIHRPVWNGGSLRIGAFGSLRVQKNFSTAIDAALIIARDLKVRTEIWINAGRTDGTGNVVYLAAKAWTKGVPNVELKELHWSTWPEFRRWVGSMNLLLQPSYTETFNNVTADGVAEGTPSVVSDVIDWCPDSWMASADDSMDVACVGRRLLMDHHAAHQGYESLKLYVERGLCEWEKFLR